MDVDATRGARFRIIFEEFDAFDRLGVARMRFDFFTGRAFHFVAVRA